MKASIIIRAYNAEETIARAVESALDQDFQPDAYEVMVVNDGSRDCTREILERYRGAPNLVIVDQLNSGAIVAANRGFAASRGEYVVLLDSDDTFARGLVRELSGILDARADVQFVYPDYYEVSGTVKTLVLPQNIFETVAVGVMFRKTTLAAEGYYREGVGFAEYDLLLRTLDRWQGYHHPRPLFTYYRRPGSATADPVRVTKCIEQLSALHQDKHDFIGRIRSYALTPSPQP